MAIKTTAKAAKTAAEQEVPSADTTELTTAAQEFARIVNPTVITRQFSFNAAKASFAVAFGILRDKQCPLGLVCSY